jgi:hypothetical protein
MKNDTPRHPKMTRLAQILRIEQAHAVGIMECIWHWAADFVQRGNIGKYSNTEIAEASMGWTDRSPDELVDAMVEAGWLDTSETYRLLIHDWPDHADEFVHRWLIRRRLFFADGTTPKISGFETADRPGIEQDYKKNKAIDISNPPFPELWAEFWAAWPKYRRNNRIPALKAWCRIVTSETIARQILAGQRRQLQPGGVLANPDPKFIPFAVTWLNNERWKEDYTPPPPKPGNAPEPFEGREPSDADLAVGMGAKP